METTRNRTLRTVITLTLIFTCIFLLIPDPAMSQTAIISPTRLNLSSDGLAESIQAIIHMPIEDGYELSGFDVQLLLGDVWLADAYSFTYCDYDQAFIASFDKRTVTDNPVLLTVAGERVALTVEGQYLAVNADGNVITHTFSYSGKVWITAPGNKQR